MVMFPFFYSRRTCSGSQTLHWAALRAANQSSSKKGKSFVVERLDQGRQDCDIGKRRQNQLSELYISSPVNLFYGARGKITIGLPTVIKPIVYFLKVSIKPFGFTMVRDFLLANS